MAEMKTLNGYEVVDAKARADIEALKATQPEATEHISVGFVKDKNLILFNPAIKIDGKNLNISGYVYNKNLIIH